MSAYSTLLPLHAVIRWFVFALAGLACARALVALRAGRPYGSLDRRIGTWLIAICDLQLLLGFLLYTTASPFTHMAFGNVRNAMQSAPLRFWLIEHPFAMIIGALLFHVGRVCVRKAESSVAKHRLGAWLYGLGLAVLFVGTPWPGLPYGRPLLRVFCPFSGQSVAVGFPS